MELKPGYKRTEVGVVPEDWDVVTASDACELVVDCKNRTPPVVNHSDYAVVRTPNVRNGQFVVEDLRFTDENSYREWTARAVPQNGDIMITREAPLGEVCAVPADRKVCLGQRMMLYRPSLSRTNSSYLLYSLMSLPVRANLLRKIGGSTVGHAKVDDIRFLQLPLPSLSEQRSIATSLSDVDALLSSLDQLIAKKRDIKQATMQQLLTGKQRLPGFSGEWETKFLGDVTQIVSGGTPKTSISEYWDGGIPWCTPTDITSRPGKYLRETARTISSQGLAASSATLLPAGSLLLCSRATIGELKISTTPVSTNQGFKALICGSAVNNEFLYYVLLTMKAAMVERASGSTFLEISKGDTSRLAIYLPQLDEQVAIASVLSDMDVEITELEQKREKTRALKQGMMQELLTGRIRLV
ncbi:restriction endonuclease subunit S [Paraburkholderia tropica]|uniref:restriction endonuclease subunit S n=1 Tax=Paraburkholderia tropica TaxID=92647 RepID=UPI001F333CBB|nr:restriction endonuclease subunit S [Paraburkholderia tropica]